MKSLFFAFIGSFLLVALFNNPNESLYKWIGVYISFAGFEMVWVSLDRAGLI